MKTNPKRRQRSECPINLTLEIVGDSWSLLIVRDLILTGAKTFNEFLHAKEKIATNILTNRLQNLEINGIIAKQRDPQYARRSVYRLTDKGMALAPVLVEIIQWSTRYETTNGSLEMVNNIHENYEKFIADSKAGSDCPSTVI